MYINIAELYKKSKNKLNDFTRGDFYTITIIIFIGFIGFGLGRLSSIEENREEVKIEFPEYLSASVLNGQKTNKEVVSVEITENLIVASKNGSKYHYPWCSGGKSVSEENKIYFNSIQEAREAGYTPAKNCKGLK